MADVSVLYAFSVASGRSFLHLGAMKRALVTIRKTSHPRYSTIVYFRQGGKRGAAISSTRRTPRSSLAKSRSSF